jgi:two-component system, NtrC family, response regulator HydG
MSERTAILVVDDELGIREMLAFALAAEDLEVVTVESGLLAIEVVQQRAFSVIITDLKMPGMDGVATAEALRRIDPTLAIIVATAYGSEAETSSLDETYDFIQKPFDLGELRQLIDRAIAKHRLARAVAS